MNKLDNIKNRLAAATPGPWEAHFDTYASDAGNYQGGYIPGVAEEGHDGDGYFAPLTEEDAEFIAHAPEDIARLVKALEAVTALADAAKPLTVWGGGTAPGIVSAGDIQAAITEALDS